jgi:O-antigen/teichoic acid export membrane protein
MYQRIARSYGMNIVFSISGIMNAAILLLLELIFLSIFHMSIDGMLLAYIISGVIVIIYLEIKVKALKGINISHINKSDMKEITKLSIPLIPNNICWWATASINKFIILYYLGDSANGIYAITLKFASIITIVTSVFALAWQETTIIEYNNKDKEKFNSSIFAKYYNVLILSSLMIILLLKLTYNYIVSPDYYQSWIYLPITILGTVFTAICTFYGTGYLASKRTKGAFYSTIISAIINIVICWSLVRVIGIMAAPLSSLVAYLSLWVIRHFTMKDFFKINVNKHDTLFLMLVFCIATYIYYTYGFILNLITFILILLISLIYGLKILREIFPKFNIKK